MNLSYRKINAIYKKDFLDAIKNPVSFITCLASIGITLLIGNIMGISDKSAQEFILTTGVIFNLSLVSTIITSTSIAEEEEKNTLKTLLLSNVSSGDFFLAKILVSCTVSTIGNTIIFLLPKSK